MKLIDASVGQTIYLQVNDNNYVQRYYYKEGSLIPALVLRQDSVKDITEVGWTNGQIIPHYYGMTAPVHPDWISKYGIVTVHKYINACFCSLEKTGNGPIAKAIGEKACRNSTCKKPNDLGAKACWWCQVPNPTS